MLNKKNKKSSNWKIWILIWKFIIEKLHALKWNTYLIVYALKLKPNKGNLKTKKNIVFSFVLFYFIFFSPLSSLFSLFSFLFSLLSPLFSRKKWS